MTPDYQRHTYAISPVDIDEVAPIVAETLAIFGYGATVMATVGIWAGVVETGAVVTVCIPITDNGESKSRAAGGMAPFGGSWKYSGQAGLSALESQLAQHFPQCQLLQHEVQAVNLSEIDLGVFRQRRQESNGTTNQLIGACTSEERHLTSSAKPTSRRSWHRRRWASDAHANTWRPRRANPPGTGVATSNRRG